MPSPHAELSQQARDVVFDRLLRQPQTVSDRTVPQSSLNAPKYLFLAGTQARRNERTLAYASLNIRIRLLVWVAPVLLYLRYIECVDLFVFLKLKGQYLPSSSSCGVNTSRPTSRRGGMEHAGRFRATVREARPAGQKRLKPSHRVVLLRQRGRRRRDE